MISIQRQRQVFQAQEGKAEAFAQTKWRSNALHDGLIVFFLLLLTPELPLS
uniref:Uncharacterized protein n=1 Tax=Nelumbo nucifera TaxID=4432 RepID=A0A822YQ31_NELNU|nr:TPA_asm: hypothetical protein HUJ06_012562 [Nelumbo nucifera]